MNPIYCLLIFVSLSCSVRADSALVYSSNLAKSICEDAKGYTYEQRFQLIHTLDSHISMGDMEYYLDFLNRPFEKGNLSEGQLDTLKNDLADKLLMQRTAPRGFTEGFLKMMDQEALGVVWRDYVLQKLPDLYERAGEKDRSLILSKLWEATDLKTHTFSGTALLGLRRINSMYPEAIDSDQFAEKALAVVAADTFPEPNRVTALQLLAEVSHPEALSLARKLLGAESSVMLHMSALGVLGIMGVPADKEILLRYNSNTEFRLRKAAQSALKRLGG